MGIIQNTTDSIYQRSWSCFCSQMMMNLFKVFKNWSMYRQLDDVLNWEFCQWIRDWSLERELEDQMSVAFPAEIIEEAQEHGGNWDAVDGPEDVALQDPVEDLTQEETLLDDVDISWIARG